MATVAEVLDAALALPPDDRRAVADRLLASVEGGVELSPEWRAEIARRHQAEVDGSMPYHTPDEVDQYLAEVDAESRGP